LLEGERGMEPEAVYTKTEDGTYGVAWVDDLGRVGPRAVRWLWPGRVPLGKVTLLVGDPGRGKSLLALDMAARVSRGAPWPDACGTCGTGAPACAATADGGCATSQPTAEGGCATQCAPLGRTVLLSAEDDTADTIRPRLDALGGDASRVSVVRCVNWEDVDRNEPLSLARDMELLRAVSRKRSDTRLVVLDPISAYLGGGESCNNADLRRVLARVKALAEELDLAVLAITHLTKRRAAEAGLSRTALRKARRDLRVATFHGCRTAPWLLRLPGDPADAEPPSPQVGPSGVPSAQAGG